MGGVVLGRTFPGGPLSLDFIARDYRRGDHPIGAGFAVQLGRSAAAAALDIDEDVVAFPARRPRVTDGKGLVLDPARVSTIENARDMNGAAVGVVGSGGALPDGWHVSEEWTEVEVLAVTVGDAFTTIEVRLTCDNSAGSVQRSPRIRFAPENGIPASPEETWAGSVFAEVLSSNALKNRLALLPRNASGSGIVSTYASLPSVFSRVGVSATLPVGTVEVETAVQITVPAETNVVVELRLAVPMLELGAGVTSPIRRTNGEVVIGTSVVDASFAGAQEGEVGDTATAWERGANALAAPDMQGAVVGTVGSGGAMPTGWFNSSNIDTIEVLDVTDTGPFTRIDIRLTRTNGTGSNQTMQVRLEPGNGLDAYRSTGAPAAAFALAGGMLQAAEAGVLSGARNDTGTAQIERWLGTSGSAWLKICRAGFGTPEERATIEKHLRDMADELIAFQLLKRATGSSYAINNHYFWAAWGIAVVGLILGERDYIDFGHECLEFAIDASADAGAIVIEVIPGDEDDGEGFPGGDDDPDPETEEVEGTQPAEVVRLTRATHYHNFAMAPLVGLAEIAIADGRDPYARRDGHLHKMVEFTTSAVDDPSIVTAVQEAILGEGNGAVQDTSMWTGPEGIVAHRLPNGSQMSWMWIYARRFPDRAPSRVWAPRFHEVYTSLRSSNLGGDMRVLHPWRHPTPAALVITGGEAPSTTASAPTLSGTAEPGAKVTVRIGDANFVTAAGSGGVWSLSLPGFAAGTYAVAAVQATALGIHPPKRGTLTVTA